MSTSTYTKSGTKATTPAKLDKSVFGVTAKNHELIKSAYTAYLSKSRRNLAVTKTRGLVRGGGKKPWKQKGTGRARFGSSRVPIWRSGGITFGPTGLENYSKQLSTKAKRQAIRQALSLGAKNDKIVIIEDIISKNGKTTDLHQLLVKINATRKVLIVVESKTPELMRAASNLQDVSIISAKFVNTYEVMNADRIVFSQAALQTTTEWLNKDSK